MLKIHQIISSITYREKSYKKLKKGIDICPDLRHYNTRR